jgi:hypothetical protein
MCTLGGAQSIVSYNNESGGRGSPLLVGVSSVAVPEKTEHDSVNTNF